MIKPVSIAKMLERQTLTAERNKLICELLQNSAAQSGMLNSPNFGGSLGTVSAMDASFGLDNIANSTQLMAVNAELSALDSSSRLNYLA